MNDIKRFVSILGLLGLTACAGPAQQATGTGQREQPRPQTVLRLVESNEPQNLATKFNETGGRTGAFKIVVNAGLTVIDKQLQPQGVLAEQVPELNSGSWKVLPDGKMETTYKLRPNLTWQDGQPLTADDFVFSWRVYTTNPVPWVGQPQDKMQQVTAPDQRTLVINWSVSYPYAGSLGSNFEPLPAHLLRDPFQAVEQGTSNLDAFMGLPFWTQSYVGAGPWRLSRWELGAFTESFAFDGFALGRPKIDRVVVRPIGDENTILANLLASELDYARSLTLRFEHGAILNQEWVPSGKGKYEVGPDYFVMNIYQLRPEFQKEPAIFDIRVRQAMIHGVDVATLADGLFDGKVPPTDSLMYRYTSYYQEANQVLTKYPYDPRRPPQLLEEAGLRRGADGYYVNPDGRRFEPDFQVRAGTQQERGQQIQIDGWRREGMFVTASVLPNVTSGAIERHNYPGFVLRVAGLESFDLWISDQIGTAANRWAGNNRTGWSSPEFDRLYAAYSQNLDRKEMDKLSVRMLQILHDQVPGYTVYDSPALLAYTSALRGPSYPVKGLPPETEMGLMSQWEIVK